MHTYIQLNTHEYGIYIYINLKFVLTVCWIVLRSSGESAVTTLGSVEATSASVVVLEAMDITLRAIFRPESIIIYLIIYYSYLDIYYTSLDFVFDLQKAVVFHGRVWVCTWGGGGRVGRLTHCGEAECLVGGFPSTRVNEEKVEDEAEEAIAC